MSGTRCSQRKMMGRGADGGCGIQEKPCPVSRVSTRNLSSPNQTLTLDFYTQARKALCERSPFESEEAASRVSTLPVGLTAFLYKYSDGRRKHQKSSSHSESGAKAPRAAAPNVWVATEEYFRHITLADVETLLSKSDVSPASDSCFSVPSLPVDPRSIIASSSASVGAEGNAVSTETEACGNVAEVQGSESVAVAQEFENEGQPMEIDVLLHKEGENSDSLMSPLSIDLHWLFGSKHKVLLTSERPSKKRKLLGGDAGLERLVIVGPLQGGSSVFCDACCSSDCSEQLNRFLFCNSCNVCVHQKCYGVQDIPMEGWLCSLCRQRDRLQTGSTGKLAGSDAVDLSSKPCLLCPKQGGALKHVGRGTGRSGNGGNVKFAHLFCSLWMPEVYVKNMESMEPVMNIGEIKDTRRRLVCFLCKVKYGVCIRCSHGTCRTSFHPICAREAKLRMEVWGKVGCDNVELRAFCSKHSGSQDASSAQQSENIMPVSVTVGSNSPEPKLLPTTAPLSRSRKVKLGRKNIDNSIVDVKSTADNCNEQSKIEKQLEGDGLSMRSDNLRPECGDAPPIINMEKSKVTETDNNGDTNAADSLNLVLILKKLINQGKASVNDIASEVGIPSESLAATLADERALFSSEMRVKMMKWLRNSNDNGMSFGAMVAQFDAPAAVKVAGQGPDSTGVVAVTSLPPRRRAKGKIRILKGNKIVCTSGETCDQQNGNRLLINETGENQLSVNEDTKKDSVSISCDQDHPYKEPEVTGKACSDCPRRLDTGVECCKDPVQKILEPPNSLDTGVSVKMANNNISGMQRQPQSTMERELTEGPGNGHADEADVLQNIFVMSSGEHQNCAAVSVSEFRNGEPISSSYIHPFIDKSLKQKYRRLECDGQRENCISSMEATCSANICCKHQAWPSSFTDMNGTLDDGEGEQLAKARKMGIFDLSPEDEVEGELLYFQNRLLDNAVASKHRCEDLIFRVVTNLPHELDELRKQRWDAVLINQYLREVREAKKRGRKERRHREAQAVLAAATAAAAASSRISSFRKDAHDEAVTTLNEGPLKVNNICGRAGPQSHLMPRAKETLSRLALPKISSGQTEIFQFTSDFSSEHPQTCDVCSRSETILNQVLVCCNCKVSVHLGCYKSIKDSVGPWYCELCRELCQDRSHFVVQCGLCNGTTGAFRKSTDGQWVHAFCAEWVLESTFRRGQLNPVEGLEGVSKERDRLACCICRRKHGVCIRCGYEDCQSTFHPLCAKNATLYMNVKSGGGKFQHKAYCGKHSFGQREKDESEQHGAEELCSIKQIRVDLEKVRLLCERIIKREKLKRELLLCSHDILASKRDNVAFSVLVHSSFLPPDVSSESVTTSLKGHADDNKSFEAIQRSDDVTEDSTVSGTCQITLPMHMDIDRKTDDSSTSQRPCTRKSTDMMLFSGKQLPHRPASIASQSLTNNWDSRLKSRKYKETFQKELIMTSDQASMQNQRLPKGFVYVPICSIPKEKPASHDTGSHESLDPDG